jgi:hypothetical protein
LSNSFYKNNARTLFYFSFQENGPGKPQIMLIFRWFSGYGGRISNFSRDIWRTGIFSRGGDYTTGAWHFSAPAAKSRMDFPWAGDNL